MSKKNKWNYSICVSYLNILFCERNLPFYLNTSSDYVQSICDRLNIENNDENYKPEDLLCNIFSLYTKYRDLDFICPIIPGGKVQNFYKSKDKNIKIDSLKIKEGLIKAILYLKEQFDIQNKKVIYDDSISLQSNIVNIMHEDNVCELEVFSILYKQGDILIDKNNPIRKVLENTQSFNMKSIDKNNQDLNMLRKEIAKVFNHSTKEYNLFLLNDGTGSGKTHNVVMNFIEDYPNKMLDESEETKRKSLIFIAPQKNQLFVDDSVFLKAEQSHIPLLFARSRDDLINLESKNYLSLNKETKSFNNVQGYLDQMLTKFKSSEKKYIDKTIKKLFEERIAKTPKNSQDIDVDKIPSVSILESTYKYYRDFEQNHITEKKYNYKWYEDTLKVAKKTFAMSLNNLAKFFSVHCEDKLIGQIFKASSTYEDFSNFKNLFKNNDKLYELIYKVLLYVMPLEVAKHINSIIYLTGDKSQTVLPISEVSIRNPEIKVHKYYELKEIISGYSISKKVDILKYSRDDNNFGKFLEQEYFIKNEQNYFLANNLGFSIVEDEEHVLYNMFVEDYTFKNITERKDEDKVNTIHALASLTRWIKNSQVEKRNILNFPKIVEEKTNIVNKLFSSLIKHTSFTDNKEIEDFFDIISANEFGIFVKTSDYEFINTVCDNIISFSPRLIMLQDYLKSIKLILDKGADYLLISKDNKKYKEEQLKYSLFDFFQIILTVLYVCKDCSQDLRHMLFTEKSKNNQNVSLYHLLNLAHDNKEFLNNLFSSSLDLNPDDKVNLQFAYFLTKIGFNFIFPEMIPKKEFNEDSIPVEPHIFIIKELPEVSVLQILNNPENKVFLLSATRGFNNIFSGNYSEYFFKEINKYLPNKIKIFQREKQTTNPMPNFIESRFDKRKSIEIIRLEIKNNRNKTNKSPDTVDSTVYPINQISLEHLDKNNDIIETSKNYHLINGTTKNYLEDLVNNVKHTNQFKYLSNPYSKAEIIGILNATIHAFENNEHAIVMTLSNRFYKDFLAKEEFMNEVFKNIQPLRSDEDNKYKVFEYSPIVNSNKKLRLIFFDSILGKVPDLKEHFIIDPDTIIVLISSYRSAGTGLNLTLEDKKLNRSQDFNSIYFVSSPYYTNIMNENGYGNLANQLLVYKYFAHTGNKTIKDLSEGLSSTKIKSVLRKEHTMEKVKSLMQSAGRIERRDSEIDTKIYFVENSITPFFEESMSNFNQMFDLHSNQHSNTIVANFSMLNKSLLKSSLNHINTYSLTTKEKNTLEKISNDQFRVFQNFFCDTNNFPKMLHQYRLQDSDYVWVEEFNSIFREYVKPNYNLKQQLINFLNKHRTVLQKSNSFASIRNLLDAIEFDFDKNQVSKNKFITIDYEKSCYSDYSNNIRLVTDKHFFDYGDHISLNEIDPNEDFLKRTLTKYSENSILTKLPNVYLSHIIRGNIGEHILSDYFSYKGIIVNNIEEIFNISVKQKLYELFDFYVIKNNTIYCIDTKNWSLHYDNGARKTLLTFPQKIEKVKSTSELQGYNFQFIYLNMFPNLNSAFTNGLSSHLGNYKNTHYINFIAKKPTHELVKLKNKAEYMKRKEELYSINEQWRNLI